MFVWITAPEWGSVMFFPSLFSAFMRKPSDSWETCNSHAPSILSWHLKVERQPTFVNKPLSLALTRGRRGRCLSGCVAVYVLRHVQNTAHASDWGGGRPGGARSPSCESNPSLSSAVSLFPVCLRSVSLKLMRFPLLHSLVVPQCEDVILSVLLPGSYKSVSSASLDF